MLGFVGQEAYTTDCGRPLPDGRGFDGKLREGDFKSGIELVNQGLAVRLLRS
jgi:hypothetical protein